MVQRGMMSLVLACVCIVLAQDADVINPVKLVQEASQDTDIGKIEIKEVSPTDEITGVHTRMNVQGYLLDNNGTPIQGNIPITFRIYDAWTGGNLIWGPEVDTVYCHQGIFNFLIGGKIPINPSVFTLGTYRTLEMTINGQTMQRIVITTSGYAFMAGKSDSSAWAYNSDKLDNYDAGNGTGRIPISNSTRCVDLNADMLDGYHASNLPGDGNNYPTGISFSGSTTKTLTLTRNGMSSLTASFTDMTGSVPVPLNLSGSDANYIIRAYNSGSGHGIRGISAGNYGVFGQSDSPSYDGVYGTGSDGVTGYGNDRGIYGNGGDDGIVGYSTASGSTNYGVYGQGAICGVSGYSYNSSGDRYGVRGNSGGGWGYLGAQISGTNYKVYGSGNVACVMSTHQGNKVLFAAELPEPYFEDIGNGQLINGYCHIELDLVFIDCIKTDNEHPLRVFVQLTDACNGVYVKALRTGFDVHELNNGTSNASFIYRVIANRKDTDYLRFPKALIDPGLEETIEDK